MQSAESNLIDVLDEQITCARAMLGTLESENHALEAGDSEQLNAASADKARLVESLESLERERRELAEALGVTPAAPGSADARRKWQELMGLIERCRDNNLRNGSLVQARREQITVALKLLRGEQPEVYDAHGQEASDPGTQRLGSA